MSKQTKQVKFADIVHRDLPTPKTDPNLLCPSCKKCFVSPLLLPCLHSICKECLDKEKLRLKNGKVVRCPTCSEHLDLQTAFPVNFILNNLINKAAIESNNPTLSLRCDSCDTSEERAVMRCNECYLFLCNFCATAHRRMNATKTHKISSVQELRNTTEAPLSRPCFCVTHPRSQILYFCQSCMTGVCRDCVLAKHKDHQLLRLEQAYSQLKSDIASLTDEVQRKQKQMSKAVSTLQSTIAKVEKHSSKVRCDIEEYFEALLVAVRQRMRALLDDLKNKSDNKLHKLQDQKLKLELSMKVTQNCCTFSENVLLRGSEVEVISVSHAILQKLTQLQAEEFTPPTIDSRDQKNFMFNADGENLIEMISKAGFLDDTCPSSDPSLCTLSINALHVTVKEVSRFTVTAINSRGFRQSKGGDAVTVQLAMSKTQSNAEDAGFKYSVRDHNHGQYTIAFLVNKPDNYLLQVNINGCAVQGSPVPLKVTPKDWIGSGCIITGENCGGLSSPHSVMVDWNNNIVIADSHNHTIKTLDSEGHLKRTIGSQGVRDGQFNFPYCIALNHTFNLLAISDSHNNRIQVIDNTSGQIRKSFGVYGTGDGMLNHPHGIAFDSNDSIYIADSGNSRLQIFSPEGHLLGKLESRYFVRPWGVTVTRDNLIGVTDYNLHKVLIFDKRGTMKLQFGTRGSGDGELNNPAGIVVDDEDQFVIADRSNHRVQIFQRDGTYVTKFGGKGTGDGMMRFPAGVAVDKSGHLYVADTLNNRIQIFSLTAV